MGNRVGSLWNLSKALNKTFKFRLESSLSKQLQLATFKWSLEKYTKQRKKKKEIESRFNGYYLFIIFLTAISCNIFRKNSEKEHETRWVFFLLFFIAKGAVKYCRALKWMIRTTSPGNSDFLVLLHPFFILICSCIFSLLLIL